MTYDSRRQRVVLFGGRDGSELFADTWDWEGAAWRLLNAEGPQGRGIYALVDDRARGELLFHGGGSMPADRWEFYHQTWIFSGGAWKLRWPGPTR
jgi:hypothetical protein